MIIMDRPLAYTAVVGDKIQWSFITSACNLGI